MSDAVTIQEEVVTVSIETGDVEVVSIGVQGPPGASVPTDISSKADKSYVDEQDAALAAALADKQPLGDYVSDTELAAALAAKADASHTQTSSTITDFDEAVQDAVAALLASGTQVNLSYNDAGNSLQISATGADAETMRDTIGSALVGVGNISVTVNDAGDTIAISTTATANDTDANLRDRSTHTGTQLAATIADFNTATDARIALSTTDWQPADFGFKSWAFDISGASNSYAMASGTMFTIRLKLGTAQTITSVSFIVSAAGSGLTHGYVAIYQDDVLISQSANSTASFTSSGSKTIAVPSASVTAGYIDVAIWVAGTTPPSITRASTTSGTAGFLTGRAARFATANTGLTATAPATLGTKTSNQNNVWAAVS